MDLHEFKGGKMYFEESLSDVVKELLDGAADAYGEGDAEKPLLKAFYLSPHSLTVLVALYRYYYYQHRYEDALAAADSSLRLASTRLGFPSDWREMNLTSLGYGVMESMTLVRFYLLALKGAGYLSLRLGQIECGVEMLEKVLELDSKDRLGVSVLLNTVENYQRRKDANFGDLKLVV